MFTTIVCLVSWKKLLCKVYNTIFYDLKIPNLSYILDRSEQ